MELGFEIRRRLGTGLYRGLIGGLFLAMMTIFCIHTALASAPNACRLVSNAEVHSLAPSLANGRPGKINSKNVSTCEWPDAHGIPALMVQINPAPSHSLRKDLATGIAAMGGYDIKSVPGLGDEAAMAVQQANPKYGLKVGVAILSVRVGKRVVSVSPMRISIKPGTAKFKRFKQLAARAASHL